jgi:hypothetical protein
MYGQFKAVPTFGWPHMSGHLLKKYSKIYGMFRWMEVPGFGDTKKLAMLWERKREDKVNYHYCVINGNTGLSTDVSKHVWLAATVDYADSEFDTVANFYTGEITYHLIDPINLAQWENGSGKFDHQGYQLYINSECTISDWTKRTWVFPNVLDEATHKFAGKEAVKDVVHMPWSNHYFIFRPRQFGERHMYTCVTFGRNRRLMVRFPGPLDPDSFYIGLATTMWRTVDWKNPIVRALQPNEVYKGTAVYKIKSAT